MKDQTQEIALNGHSDTKMFKTGIEVCAFIKWAGKTTWTLLMHEKASINSIKIKRFQSVDQNEMILMIMNSSIVGNAGGDHNSIN